MEKQNRNVRLVFCLVSSSCDRSNPQMSLKPILDDCVIFIWPTLSLSRFKIDDIPRCDQYLCVINHYFTWQFCYYPGENKVKCQVCYDCLTRSIFPSWSSPLLKQNHEDFIGHFRQEMGRFGRDPWHNQIPYFTLWTKSFCWCHFQRCSQHFMAVPH